MNKQKSRRKNQNVVLNDNHATASEQMIFTPGSPKNHSALSRTITSSKSHSKSSASVKSDKGHPRENTVTTKILFLANIYN